MNHLLLLMTLLFFAEKEHCAVTGIDVEIQELIVDAHHNVYYLVKITLEMPMMRIYISLFILSMFYKFYWQSFGQGNSIEKTRINHTFARKKHEKRRQCSYQE